LGHAPQEVPLIRHDACPEGDVSGDGVWNVSNHQSGDHFLDPCVAGREEADNIEVGEAGGGEPESGKPSNGLHLGNDFLLEPLDMRYRTSTESRHITGTRATAT